MPHFTIPPNSLLKFLLQNDLDYIDDNAEKLGRQKMRSDAMKRQFAINGMNFHRYSYKGPISTRLFVRLQANAKGARKLQFLLRGGRLFTQGARSRDGHSRISFVHHNGGARAWPLSHCAYPALPEYAGGR